MITVRVVVFGFESRVALYYAIMSNDEIYSWHEAVDGLDGFSTNMCISTYSSVSSTMMLMMSSRFRLRARRQKCAVLTSSCLSRYGIQSVL